jgi:hypothetical protein
MPEQANLQTPAGDSVLADFELPHSAVLHPLGYPLRIESNSREVIAAASRSWSAFSQRSDHRPAQRSDHPPAQRSDHRPVRISIGVSETAARISEAGFTGAPPVYRSRDHLMSIVSDAENFVSCDFNSGFAFGWVTPDTVSDHGFFRYYFLDAAILALLTQLYLAPVHAALVQLDGSGVMLCGESHAGKSTLAYACARAGWNFICDDGTALIRDRDDRYAIGNPSTLRLREEAKLLFPELEDCLAVVRPNGRIGIEVFTNRLPISIAEGCVIDHVVFLNRRESAPKLVPFETEAALGWFEQFSMCWGSKHVQEHQRNTYRRLLGASTWELRYRDLDGAVATLERLVRRGM